MTYRPGGDDYTRNVPVRGDGRGLGKPIRQNGKWIGQSRCDIVNGHPVFLEVDRNGNVVRTSDQWPRRF